MVATYDADTYDSETYDTGEEPVKKHGLPFSVFEWAWQRRAREEELEAINKVTILHRQSFRATSNVSRVERQFLELLHNIETLSIAELCEIYKLTKLYNAARAFMKTTGARKVSFEVDENNEK